MRKIIYIIGGIFLSIGVVFAAIAIKAAMVYEPSLISTSEFKKILQNKNDYSSIYLHEDNVVLCLDTKLSIERKLQKKEKKLKCWSKIRTTKFSLLDNKTKDEILKLIKK